MLRKVTVLLLAATSALSCAAQTQTPRQALIEMFSGRDQKTFERHLPKVMQQRLAALSSGSHMNFPTSPEALPIASGRKGDLHWFETGPILLLAQDTNGRFEVRVDKEILQGDRDDLDLSFNMTSTAEMPAFGNGTRVMLTMQKEEGIWRLSEFGLNFKMKLDGTFLEAMAKRMGAMSKPTMTSMSMPAEPVPGRKMSAQELSQTETTALTSLRKLLDAQRQYRTSNPSVGFTCNSDALGVTEVSGYRTMVVGCKGNPTSSFKITLTPMGMGIKGQRAFCSDETGVIRYADDGKGVDCLSDHNEIELSAGTAEGR